MKRIKGKGKHKIYNFSELSMFFGVRKIPTSESPLVNSNSVALQPISISGFPNCILAFLLDFMTINFSVFSFIK